MAGESRSQRWALLLAFVVTAAILAGRTIAQSATVPLLNDSDDAMRLVVVRDLIAGQGWFDHMQYRLNVPFGTDMHWSRLIDLPIAALIVVLRPLLGAAAETVAAFFYPLTLLLVLLWLNLRLVLRLVGSAGLLPALVLPALSLVTFKEFSPGRFDHHSAQILLLLATLLFAIGAVEKPSRGIWAGICSATALAIGVESLPTVVAAIAAFGLLWVGDPTRARAMRLFGLGLAGGMAVNLVIALPPERWLSPMCDEISIVYVAAGIGAGLMLAGISLLPVTRPWIRLATGVVAGGLLTATILLAFPECRGGPYAAVDPWLIANWMDQVAEAKPLLQALADDPASTLALAAPAVIALAVAIWRCTRGPERDRSGWRIYLIFLGLMVVVMLIQLRAARMATSLAIPAGAYIIAVARQRYLTHRTVLATLALIAGWFGFAGAAWALAASQVTGLLPADRPVSTEPATATLDPSLACRMPSAYASLAALPAARIMSPVDLGSHLLAFTPHSVVGGPYHRDIAGLHDTFDFFNQPIDKAREILTRRGVTLVVICPGLPELQGVGEVASDSFNRLYAKGALPGWLVDESDPTLPLKVYAVAPGS